MFISIYYVRDNTVCKYLFFFLEFYFIYFFIQQVLISYPFYTQVLILEIGALHTLYHWILTCEADTIIILIFKNLFIYLFISGCTRPALLCAGPLQLQQAGATPRHGTWSLTTVAPPTVEHGHQGHGSQQLQHTGPVVEVRRLSSCGAGAQLLRGMWDPPGPGLEPLSPAPAGGLSTTAPPEMSPIILLLKIDWGLKSSNLPKTRNPVYERPRFLIQDSYLLWNGTLNYHPHILSTEIQWWESNYS